MKKRTLLSMLLMIVMAVSLVGCGDDGKSNDNNSNVADLFNPTTSDTAVNSAESNTGDPVTPYVPGASGPTNSQVETPTPEPEKNVITLMSADGSKAIHEFNIPEGYTVVSDKKSNHVELAKDGDDTIKVEIISGPCAEALSTIYQYVDGETARSNAYAYGGTYCYNNVGTNEGVSQDELNAHINEISTKSGIDKKYFTQKFSNMVTFHGDKYGFDIVAEYPEQHSLEELPQVPKDDAPIWSLHWDCSNHKDSDTYPITYYCYKWRDSDSPNYIPADETFTIKVTTTFDEDKFDEENRYMVDAIIQEKIGSYAQDGVSFLNKFLEKNFNMNTHKCEHCDFNK